ncbi:hypothetical protein N7501_006725 [Penicillium viridicatum]|nr:hypothetical protein N7501_006725 [Penicillium viridicatum]
MQNADPTLKYKLCCCPETCLLCGKHILMCDGGTVSRDHLDVLKESQWEIHRKSPIPEHILVPSTEVENKSFSKFPWLSSCYQRGGQSKLSDTLFPPNTISRELAQLHVSLVSRAYFNFQETKTPHEFLDERRYHSMMIQYSQLSIQEIAG